MDTEDRLLEPETAEIEAEDRGDDFEPTPDETETETETEAEAEGDTSPEANGEEASAEEDQDQNSAEEPTSEPEPASHVIPQSRFNEINQRYKEERQARLRLEEELARSKGQQEQPESRDDALPVDVDALEDKLDAAILEGDTGTARQLRRQIRQIEHQQIEQKALQAAQRQIEEREQAIENQRLAQSAAHIAQKYPAFDPESEQADSVLIDMVISYRDRLIASGSRPSEALTQAAETVAQRALAPARPKPAAAPKIDAQKHLSREAQIPARATGSRGARSQAVDYESLSDAEFSRLSAEDKARARGDFL